MKKLILLGFILLIAKITSAQLAIGYYPFQSELSFSTNTENVIWGDLRIASNTFLGNITNEPILMLNVKQTEMVNYYGGIGMNLNFFNAFENSSIINGYNLHVGARVKPVKQFDSLSVVFEISPYMNRNFDGGLLRSRLGVAYQFKKKNSSD